MAKKIVLGIVGLLVVLVVVGMLAGDDDEPDQDIPPALAAVGVDPDRAGCSAIEHEDPIPEGSTHRGGTLEWEDTPPNSGEHSARTLRVLTRFYERADDPPPEQVVHDLEHGIVVAWYDPELPDDEVEALRKASEEMPINRFVAVPWNRSTVPDDRHVVLTAWGHTQRCERVSGEVIFDFTRTYADSDDAPEGGAPV